jgi:hypothetical protein
LPRQRLPPCLAYARQMRPASGLHDRLCETPGGLRAARGTRAFGTTRRRSAIDEYRSNAFWPDRSRPCLSAHRPLSGHQARQGGKVVAAVKRIKIRGAYRALMRSKWLSVEVPSV